MIATTLLDKARWLGVKLTVNEAGDLAWTGPLTAELKKQLAAHKHDVVKELLIRKALGVRERFDFSPDPALAQRQMALMDAIDMAWETNDLVSLRDAVGEFVALVGEEQR